MNCDAAGRTPRRSRPPSSRRAPGRYPGSRRPRSPRSPPGRRRGRSRSVAAPDPVGGLAQRPRTANIASSATEATRGSWIPTPMPGGHHGEGARRAEEVLHDDRVDHREGEEPDDDAGDARERLEDRLQLPPRARSRTRTGRSPPRARAGWRPPSRSLVTTNEPRTTRSDRTRPAVARQMPDQSDESSTFERKSMARKVSARTMPTLMTIERGQRSYQHPVDEALLAPTSGAARSDASIRVGRARWPSIVA